MEFDINADVSQSGFDSIPNVTLKTVNGEIVLACRMRALTCRIMLPYVPVTKE